MRSITVRSTVDLVGGSAVASPAYLDLSVHLLRGKRKRSPFTVVAQGLLVGKSRLKKSENINECIILQKHLSNAFVRQSSILSKPTQANPCSRIEMQSTDTNTKRSATVVKRNAAAQVHLSDKINHRSRHISRWCTTVCTTYNLYRG